MLNLNRLLFGSYLLLLYVLLLCFAAILEGYLDIKVRTTIFIDLLSLVLLLGILLAVLLLHGSLKIEWLVEGHCIEAI